MSEELFGDVLRSLRARDGLSQAALANKIGLARSTVANVERGTWAPSERFWAGISRSVPHWTATLAPAYESARQAVLASSAPPKVEPHLGGPFDLLAVTYAYLFEESRSPHEIIEVRQVRARTSGANAYGLRLAHTQAPGFSVDQQVLWGGAITQSHHHDEINGSVEWTRVEFGRSLRAGQRHEFATRTWIERDPNPQTEICFEMTLPVRQASIHLAFHGTQQPMSVWRYGPLVDDTEIPTSAAGQRLLKMVGGTTSLTIKKPEVGLVYGLAWIWDS